MLSEHCYHNFDTLLLIDWEKAVKGNLTVLRILGGTDELDVKAWEEITEQHAETFAMDRKHLEYLRLLKNLAITQLDYVIKQDRFILNNIQVLQEQLELIVKSLKGNGATTGETLIILSEKAGYLITESNITAKRFFEMVKYYGKKNK